MPDTSLSGKLSRGFCPLLRRALLKMRHRVRVSKVDEAGRQIRDFGTLSLIALYTIDFLYAASYMSAIRRIRRNGEGRSIHELHPADWKKSDTVFILGSGVGIVDITAEQWKQVAEHDSIGFNFWPVHSFVPSLYFFEFNGAPRRDRAHLELMRKREDLYRDVTTIVNIRGGDTVLDEYPRSLRRNFFYYSSFYGAKSQKLLRCSLRAFKLSCGLGLDVRRILINHSGSLSATILFSILSGYRNIVLLGVDLDSTVYFWESEKWIPNGMPTPPNTQLDGVHSSVSPVNPNSLTIMEFVKSLRATGLLGCDVHLRILNQASPLAAILEPFSFEGASV